MENIQSHTFYLRGPHKLKNFGMLEANASFPSIRVHEITILLSSPTLLAKLIDFIGIPVISTIACLNKQWAHQLMQPIVWEMLIGVPYCPLLSNCFRRASSYCYRELDIPSPNVNRRGSPPVIRACILNDQTSMREYVDDLRAMSMETKWFHSTPHSLRVNEISELNDGMNDSHVFDNVKILSNDMFFNHMERQLLSGSLEDGQANYYLWSLRDRTIRASMTQSSASCSHYCNTALAVGCTDGTVKVWNFSSTTNGNFGVRPNLNASPTATVSHRSSIGLMPFFRTRSKDKVMQVHIDHNDGTLLHMATSTEKGEANVWDVLKGEVIQTIDASKIHQSSLSRSTRESTPNITSLMLFRNTLICGTSCGLIRVFDLRSGRLTHRLAGHPDAVMKTDTKGRVLWSAGKEGSVRWWGGKTAKVLDKSALCEGGISALEMDETLVVAGYAIQGMEAWDVRTQQTLCTFSNTVHSGVKSIQFDSRKILTVSMTGQAALWRWYCPNPVQWWAPPTSSTKIVSAQFSDNNLIFGTDSGELLDYERLL